MNLEKLQQYIESLIFVSDSPISLSYIQDSLENTFDVVISDEDILQNIDFITEKYNAEEYSFELVSISNGYQFMTKAAYHNVVSQYLRLQNAKKLSRAALETLAIIAYKQPITKTGIEQIRGVNCDYTVQKLLDKELLEIMGRADGPGKPLLYGTSEKFMDYFGLHSIGDLPKLKEINVSENQFGEPDPIVESELSEATPTTESGPEENAAESEFLQQEQLDIHDIDSNSDEILIGNAVSDSDVSSIETNVTSFSFNNEEE